MFRKSTNDKSSREETVLLQAYNGQGWKHETVGGSSFDLDRVSLIVGDLTQTKQATKLLQEDRIESGLLPRFLYLALRPLFMNIDDIKPVNPNYRRRITRLMRN